MATIVIERLRREALAPLRLHGTSLPPHLLFIVKLVIVGLFLKGYHLDFPDVFAPLAPVLEVLPAPYFRWAFKAGFILSAAALLMNRAVRTNCLIIGALFIVATLSSRVYYRNANVFCGLLFVMIGLQDRTNPPTLVFWQMGLMYFGAGLNKLFEADWRSGHYFAYFLPEIYGSALYPAIAGLLPQGWFATFLCWHVIAAEMTAGVFFIVPRLRRMAVWLAAGVHAGAAVMVTWDYGIYLSAVLASYLLVWPWPSTLAVRSGPGVAARGLTWLHRLSHGLDPSVRYEPPAGTGLAIAVDGRHHRGFGAFWRLALWTPAFYFAAMAWVTAVRGPWRALTIRGLGIATMLVLVVTAAIWIARRLRTEPHPQTESAGSDPDLAGA